MKKQSRKGFAVGVNIDGGKGTEHTKRVVGELSKHLGRAIELGREAAAIELTKQLGDSVGVKNVSITNSTFSGIGNE